MITDGHIFVFIPISENLNGYENSMQMDETYNP